MIASKRPGDYDEAVKLLKDLEAVAYGAGAIGPFSDRFTNLRARHLRKPTLIQRFDRAGLMPN
ncbi:hypothetical protein [Nonomuraea basaltis]|uniref:hypothetical protein n=1 Tax=Nonomuraea basaltis TaxID=2495887 RepID=UPI00110C44B1|nr:hypothetical protein [Nonomuraea basaltis]